MGLKPQGLPRFSSSPHQLDTMAEGDSNVKAEVRHGRRDAQVVGLSNA